MGLADYTYHLHAQSGDSTPHDELGVSGDLSGGTITLVDHSGTPAWQFASGTASVAIPSKSIDWTQLGDGVTMAIRLKVANYGSLDWAGLLGFGGVAWPGTAHNGNGVGIQKTGTGTLRFVFTTNGDVTNPLNAIGTQSGVSTSIRTIVLRVTPMYSYPYAAGMAWLDTVSREGTSPDYNSGSKDVSAAVAIDTFSLAAANGAVLEVEEAVFWPEELSDADCAALADDLRGTMASLGGSAPDAPTAGTASDITHNSATANWTDNSDDETGFKVEVGESSGGTVASWSAASGSPAAADAESLALTGLDAETTYKFRVCATNANGDSDWSESAEFTTDEAPPTPVKGVRIQLHDGATEQASLSGITALWWDGTTVASFGAPDFAANDATTDASGWLQLDLDAVTALDIDDLGFLLLYKAGGTAPDDLIFAGRLAIVDIA